MLELRGLSKSYGSLRAVRDVHFAIREGEFFSLLGPSGCGKTSLLRLLAGFESPSQGEIQLDGQRIDLLPAHQRQFNLVFQRYALFPHLSVWDNVAFGLKMKKVGPVELKERVTQALSLVQMDGMGPRDVATLSGGQQQRIALARALVNRPRILLLDEPLSALDLKLREQMQVELLSLKRRLGHTFIFVTHDQQEALTLSDRIAVMNQGIVEQVGTPQEIYEYPRTPFVAQFIGSINSIESEVKDVRQDAIALAAPQLRRPFLVKPSRDGVRPLPQIQVGASAQLLVRPEKIKILKSMPSSDQNGLEGTLKEVLYQGPVTQYIIQPKDSDGQPLLVSQQNTAVTARKGFSVGDRVCLAWLPEDCILMGASPGALGSESQTAGVVQ